MMPAITLANLGSCAAQVAALVLLASALPRLLGVTAPRAHLAYLYAVLLGCLVLPLVEPRAPPVYGPPAMMSDPAASASDRLDRATVPNAPPLGSALAVIALAGIGARFTWLGLGIRGLRALRRSAAPLYDAAVMNGARDLVGAHAEVRATPEVRVPVTFGVRHPVVLVPHDFAALDTDQQVAILCHELLHVKRRDWLASLGEEVLRSLVWFHPAIWWLVDQIQLAREQVVDQQVVALTRRRDTYLDALLQLAARPGPVPVPASFFLRRAHLPQRIALLLSEAAMSTRRLVASLLVSVVALACAALLVVRILPLAAGPLERPTPPTGRALFVGVDGLPREWPHVVRQVDPLYPVAAMNAGVGGRILVLVDVAADGTVSGARVPVWPDPNQSLARAALDAAREFRFAPLAVPVPDVPLLFTFEDVVSAKGPSFAPIPPLPPPPPRPIASSRAARSAVPR